MVLESTGSSAENEARAMRGFVMDVEAHLEHRNKYLAEYARYRAYFESLGGINITTMPFPSETSVLAKTFSPLNEMGDIQPVNSQQPMRETVIRRYSLSDILRSNPKFPDFWQTVAQDGIISNIVYSQPELDITEKDGAITIGKGGNVEIPNTLVELKDDSTSVRIFFLPPLGTILSWPRCVAEDTFTFGEVPKVIDRAFRVYCNACETRERPLFFDVDPTHARYKRKPYRRLAIEYQLDLPNRMRPVMVEV